MAARKAGKRRVWTPDERRAMRGLRRLSREAQADVKRLLKRTRKGTLTGKQLQAGLTEVASDLGAVLGFHYFRI